MKIPKIANELGQIDDDLITAAAAPAKAAKRPFVKWVILAASLGAVILLSALVLPMLLEQGDLPDMPIKGANVVSFGDLERHYKDVTLTSAESAMDWPAEYMTVEEKHRTVIWNLREYRCSGRTVDARYLDDKLGKYLGFEVYSLAGMPQKQLIAIGLDGDYYVYRGDLSDKPDTFGALNDQYHLTKILSLGRFSVYENGREQGHYGLLDDGYILEVLAACEDAPLVQNTDGWRPQGDYLSFTVTSDLLGVYKKAMYITSDGYLWTNAFDYAYVYEIGAQAAGEVIAYATAHSEPREVEPFEYSLAGTLVEIKDGYAYIDDSILCTNESEGMIFRVSTSDLRIWRSIAEAQVSVGDVVVVTFRGGVDTENGNLITGARGIARGIFAEGDVIVPE